MEACLSVGVDLQLLRNIRGSSNVSGKDSLMLNSGRNLRENKRHERG